VEASHLSRRIDATSSLGTAPTASLRSSLAIRMPALYIIVAPQPRAAVSSGAAAFEQIARWATETDHHMDDNRSRWPSVADPDLRPLRSYLLPA